jgi:hypothetical protein
MRRSLILGCVTALSLLLSGCGMPTAFIPSSLAVPGALGVDLDLQASGVQIYKCVPAADGKFTWVLKAPEATLKTPSGVEVGQHFAGPTWQLMDGSSVTAEVLARDPGPDPAAIPWLLLIAKSSAGSGGMTEVKYVQRLNTVGGVAPSGECSTSDPEAEVRVPYSARYVFYK